MHKYHEQAAGLVVSIIDELQRLLPKDGEDISFYNPGVVDEPLSKLVRVKVLTACANEATGRNTKKHEIAG